MSCSKIQRSDSGEARTRDPSSRVKHSTTEPLRTLFFEWLCMTRFTVIETCYMQKLIDLISSCVDCLVTSPEDRFRFNGAPYIPFGAIKISSVVMIKGGANREIT